MEFHIEKEIVLVVVDAKIPIAADQPEVFAEPDTDAAKESVSQFRASAANIASSSKKPSPREPYSGPHTANGIDPASALAGASWE